MCRDWSTELRGDHAETLAIDEPIDRTESGESFDYIEHIRKKDFVKSVTVPIGHGEEVSLKIK